MYNFFPLSHPNSHLSLSLSYTLETIFPSISYIPIPLGPLASSSYPYSNIPMHHDPNTHPPFAKISYNPPLCIPASHHVDDKLPPSVLGWYILHIHNASRMQMHRVCCITHPVGRSSCIPRSNMIWDVLRDVRISHPWHFDLYNLDQEIIINWWCVYKNNNKIE